MRREIPACHYMVAVFGGTTVRCADYATFGTEELSKNALKAMEGRNACLLGSHGMIVAGDTLEQAMWRASELETLAKQYYFTSALGQPVVLSDEQIEVTMRAMNGSSTYGLQDDNKNL